jgi:uncharacterized damage-inducible protein DinB
MAHLLVTQLRFARSEWLRALDGVPAGDALKRLMPMNSIGWVAAHLAWHEQANWLYRAQGRLVNLAVIELAGYGRPASTPPLDEMLDAWRAITAEADRYLEPLTAKDLQTHWVFKGKTVPADIGTVLLRMIYHYWYHTGEVMAIRQLLGHTDLPEYVGEIEDQAPYRPE